MATQLFPDFTSSLFPDCMTAARTGDWPAGAALLRRLAEQAHNRMAIPA